MDWRKHLRVHPAAELFPLLKDTDPAGFNDHVEDIRAHGLAELIVGWASKEGLFVLDGRNRLDALAHLGLLYETCDHHVGIKKWTGSEWSDQPGGRIDGHNGDAFRIIYEREGLDPYAIVISLNAHRRHLTPKLKRELIGNVLKAQTATSNRQIGIITKCDDKTVAKVRAELESTAEIPQLKKTRGRDGKARPAKKKKSPPLRKLSASEAEFHKKREQRIIKLRDDWLADHPGKTMADAEIAGTCGDTDEGEAAWSMWWAQRYNGRDPLDAPVEPSVPITEPPSTTPQGVDSDGERDRLRARIDELHAEKRLLEIRVKALENKVKEAAGIAGRARALLKHPTPSNVTGVKAMLTKIERLCEKPHSITSPSPGGQKMAKPLDQTPLEKAATAAISSMRGRDATRH